MRDCTDNRVHRPHRRFAWTSALCAALLWLGLAALPVAARADGDPASDVLATQALFVPQDAGIPIPQQRQLAAMAQAVARRGYQIRVAIIAGRSDLGSVTALWRQPEAYAKFLGQELSLVYRGPLLVVMPSGLGFDNAGPAGGGASALRQVPLRPGGTGLAATALTAIERLAAEAGDPVAIPAPAASGGRSGAADTSAIVAFAIGAALIILAWTASLRARPPGLPRGKATSA